jgi:ABC-type multidrug transport system fused ATPase/permease subunit
MNPLQKLGKTLSYSPPVSKRWIGINIFSALALAVSEYATAISIQLLFAGIGFMKVAELPVWLQRFNGALSFALVAIVAMSFARAIFLTLNYQSNYEVRETFVKHLRRIFFENIFYAKDRRSKSLQSLQLHIGEIFPKAANYVYFWIAALVALVQVAGIAGFLLWISAPMTLVSLAIIGVLGLGVLSLNRWIKEVGQEAPRAYSRLLGTSGRAIRGLVHIKLSRREEKELEELEKDNYIYYKMASKALLGSHIAGGVPIALGGSLLAVIIWVGYTILKMEPGPLISFVYLFVRFSQQISGLVTNMGQVATFEPQADLCLDFLDHQKIHTPPRHDAVAPLAAAPALRLDRISFRHEASEKPIIDSLSFEAPAGDFVLLSGRSGSGKTTLSHLILGLYVPSSGDVTLGGLRPDRFIERHYAEIAYVEANTFLFRGTLRDNLTWGLERAASDGEIFDVLKKVDMPQISLDTMIEESGQPLSSGQQQRLSIARALLRRPRLLVVDEPTSHLDDKTEILICEILRSLKGKTTILGISHQPRLKEIADHVIEL